MLRAGILDNGAGYISSDLPEGQAVEKALINEPCYTILYVLERWAGAFLVGLICVTEIVFHSST